MLDLSLEQARKDLNVSLEILNQDWRKIQDQGQESFTQTLGRAVFENGGEGLLVPSVRVPSGINMVYFPENKQRGSVAQVCESEKLDRLAPHA